MNILFITPSYKPAYIYGGTIVVVALLAESLVKYGHHVTVYTTAANGATELDVKTDTEIIVDGVKVYYFKRYTKDHSHISPGFWKKTLLNAGKFDVVHLHSWWSPAILGAAAICWLKGIKPVLSPHGMLCDYIINTKNRGKKRLVLAAGKPLLANTILHTSTQMEWNECQAILNNKWKGAIVPNMVQLSNLQPNRHKETNKPFTIGFISRVEAKKGLDLLIKALSKVSFDYRLQIAGSGEAEYVEQLKQLAVDCGSADKLEWVGWMYSVQKFEFYSSIDLFALTSHNENFAVVVIESLSMGTPVFLSEHVGLAAYVKEKDLGWVTTINDVPTISANLEKAYHEQDKQMLIRATAPDVIAKDYDDKHLSDEYIAFYTTTIAK